MNQTPMNQKEIQAVCMDMLRLIDRICRKERIPYFLSGGTLLGAVRHKGFIPWDDDIDIMIPRPEFERFLLAAPKYMSKRYFMAHCSLPGDYATPWVRLWDMFTHLETSGTQKVHTEHLFLDVFPIDALPTNETLSKLHFRRMRAHDILLKLARRKSFYPDERLQWLKKLLMPFANILTAHRWAIIMDRAADRGDFYNAKYAGVCVITHYSSRERMPVEVFRGSIPVTFEGEQFPAPVGYHTYLKNLYGDYMKLPPEDQRRSRHNIKAFYVPEEDA
ncbi:MAG: LicD family protein [Clostridia bacterium]|nr:LicD family protein [Clostridia bacterium]